MIESFRSIASSATDFVRSTERRKEFSWRRRGSNGASSSTKQCQYREKSLFSSKTYIQCCRNSCLLTLLDILQDLMLRLLKLSNYANVQLSHGTDDSPRIRCCRRWRSHPTKCSSRGYEEHACKYSAKVKTTWS